MIREKIHSFLLVLLLSSLFLSSAHSANLPKVCLIAEKEGNLQKKIELFTKCIREEFKPIKLNIDKDYNNLSLSYFGRAVAYLQNGDYALAKNDFNAAIAMNPNNPEFYKYRGLLFKKINNKDEAIIDFSNAIKHAPNDSELFFLRGMTYGDLKKYNLAIDDLLVSIKNNRNNLSAYSLLGNYYCEEEDYKKAYSYFEKSLEINNNNPEVLNNYAFCLLLSKPVKYRNYDKALWLSKKAVDYATSVEKKVLFLDTLAAVYAGIGNFDKATETQSEALKIIGSDDTDLRKELKDALETYKKKELYYVNSSKDNRDETEKKISPAIEFRLVYNENNSNRIPTKLPKKRGKFFLGPALLKTKDIVGVNIIRDEKYYNGASAVLTLTKKGQQILYKISKENIGRRLAILLKNEIIFSAAIIKPINSNKIILTGGYTYMEIKDIAQKLSDQIEKQKNLLDPETKTIGDRPEWH